MDFSHVREHEGVPKKILDYISLLYHGQVNQLQEWVIENGKFYTEKKKQIDSPPDDKQCYTRAYEYCRAHPGCQLVHGWAFMFNMVPLEHAWVIDSQGDPLEVTSSKLHEYIYFGMIIPIEYYERLRGSEPHDFVVQLARSKREGNYDIPSLRQQSSIRVTLAGYCA